MPKGRPTKEYQNFRNLTDKILSVPRAVVEEKIKEHREKAARNPNRPGPKPKTA